MRFELHVVDGRSAPRPLVVEAESLAEAKATAEQAGLGVIAHRLLGTTASWRMPAKSGTSRADAVLLIEQVKDLLTAGLSAMEALRTIGSGSNPGVGALSGQIEGKLRDGKPLSTALAETGRFSDLLVSLVRSSELTSNLSETLSRYLEHEARAAEVRHRIVSVAIYPTLLVVVGGLVLLFLLFHVMPRFAGVFEGMGTDLPWSAELMVAWSRTLRSTGWWWLAGGSAVAVGVALFLSAPSAREAFGEVALRIDLVWRRVYPYFLARWYRATGMLVNGGIPLTQALALSIDVLPSHLRQRGLRVEHEIRRGSTPSMAYSNAAMATAVAQQMLLAGERTGDLGDVLTRIARFHEAEVARSLERTMRVLEPVAMVLIGLGVGLVVVLMYMPIFELASSIR